MSELRHKCWTKATRREAGELRHSAAWAVSRRAWFKVFDDRIECGDWNIALDSVLEAVLFETRQWLIPVFVLQLSTEDVSYQFGFNPWCRVANHLPFDVDRQRVKMRYSPFSLALRIVVGLLLAYWLLQRFG